MPSVGWTFPAGGVTEDNVPVSSSLPVSVVPISNYKGPIFVHSIT